MIVFIRIEDAFTPLPLWVILIVFLCFYMDMNCFRLVSHVVSSWFRVGSVAADGVGGLGGWLQMVLGSCL